MWGSFISVEKSLVRLEQPLTFFAQCLRIKSASDAVLLGRLRSRSRFRRVCAHSILQTKNCGVDANDPSKLKPAIETSKRSPQCLHVDLLCLYVNHLLRGTYRCFRLIMNPYERIPSLSMPKFRLSIYTFTLPTPC